MTCDPHTLRPRSRGRRRASLLVALMSAIALLILFVSQGFVSSETLWANRRNVQLSQAGQDWSDVWLWHRTTNAAQASGGLGKTQTGAMALCEVGDGLEHDSALGRDMSEFTTVRLQSMNALAIYCRDEQLALQTGEELKARQDERPWNVLRAAKLYESLGKHQLALNELRESPQIAHWLVAIASHLYSQSAVDDARWVASLSVETNPTLPSTYAMLGRILVGKAQEPREAALVFRGGLEIAPEDVSLQVGLAHALIQLGSLDEAMPYLRAALSTNANEPLAHLLLGEVYLRNGEIDDAIEHFLACLRLQPDQVWALYGLGRAYVAEGQIQNAIDVWSEALTIAPDFDLARQGLHTLGH